LPKLLIFLSYSILLLRNVSKPVYKFKEN